MLAAVWLLVQCYGHGTVNQAQQGIQVQSQLLMASTVVARQVVIMKSGWNSTVTVGLAQLVQQSATMTSCMMAAIIVINTTFCQYLSSKECDEEHRL